MRQSLHAAWDVFRIIVGIGLLLVAGYAGWLSTLLLDLSNFRTEGSPAGTILFVVLLGAPVVAIAAFGGGIFLLMLRGRGDSSVDEAATMSISPEPATPRLAARRQTSSSDESMDLLIHDELAVLWTIRADGSGARTRNPQWRGETTYLPFRSCEGSPVRLPRSWAVPRALAVQAIDDFEQGRDWTERVSCAPTPTVPSDLRLGPDRARWEWLVQQPS